jgi:plastocyanin
MRMLAVPAAVMVVLLATACGGGGGSTTPPDTSGGGAGQSSAPLTSAAPATPAGQAAAASCAQAAATDGQVISMEGTHSLTPSDETISAGDSVTWTNNSSTNHHIKFATGPDCGFTLIGKSVSVKFDNPGTYSYVCTIHPTFMKGTITVN